MFKSKDNLVQHDCSTNWADYKSTEIGTNQIRGEGKTGVPGTKLNLSEQCREPTNSTHIWSNPGIDPGAHWWGGGGGGGEGKCCHHCASLAVF